MIAAELLDILACPCCRGNLQQSVDGSGLDCPACSLRFPVREGIPVMLAEEALNIQNLRIHE